MKSKICKYLILAILIGTVAQFCACREEIISPKNNSGNVNEPYKSSHQNSYTFILNAENISQKVIDYPDISHSNSRVFISLSDRISGSVEVVVLSKTREVLYRNKLIEDNNGSYGVVNGIKPEILEINFSEFTGKLKFQLTGVL